MSMGPKQVPRAGLRDLPSVDELLRSPKVAALADRMERDHLVQIVRERLAAARTGLLKSEDLDHWDTEELQRQIELETAELLTPSLRPVINATGVLLHTNLGRAPLPANVTAAFGETAIRYNNLEYDLSSGKRGKRDTHTSKLLQSLTGCEAAVVVNNCAAAVLVTLAALSGDGETIVSRGELIEIGDGFRIPEIMEYSGAVLREVGTTNRTRVDDYQLAINDKTRLLLRVHPSNFKVTGFTAKPTLAELVQLSAASNIPLVEDLGSGCLIDLSRYGIDEPTVRQSIEAGVGVVIFSGDKLMGGPQAGIIAGKKDLVAKVRRHPLFRALRVDKLTITALEGTLRLYLQNQREESPAMRMLQLTIGELAERCNALVEKIRRHASAHEIFLEVVDGQSLVGGGSTPSQSLPTKLIRVRSNAQNAQQIEKRLRVPGPGIPAPVIVRVEDAHVVLDLRTVFPDQECQLAEALIAALQ